MRIAAFGDIHGNIFALQAVLQDLRSQSPDGMVVFGDLVYKFPWGAEVVDLLRSFPHQALIGNSEVYLSLWDTALWPAERWNMPVGHALVQWERERLGAGRLAYLASLPEYVALSGGRLEDLLIVHGIPGDPFMPLLDRPGAAQPPWVQTDARFRELLAGVDAEMVICGHTHMPFQRRLPGSEVSPRGVLVCNPGAVGYGRGPGATAGQAAYALLDWSPAGGWQVRQRIVQYDPAPLRAALLAARGDYPIAAWMANRAAPPLDGRVPEEPMDFLLYRWGDAPEWWPERDRLPEWQSIRR